jgi:two-component system, sensor histidine kinase LadS
MQCTRRLLLALLCWSLGTGFAQSLASAVPLGAGSVATPAPVLTVQLREIAHTNAALNVQQISQAALAKAFVPFDPDATHAMSTEQPVWLHLRVQAAQPVEAGAWSLVLNRPFIDRAEWYSHSATGQTDDTVGGMVAGAWQMQVAGDWIAHRDWPVNAPLPQFKLGALAAGEHDFYLRVLNTAPLHFDAQLQPTAQAHDDTALVYVQAAVIAGCIALMLLLSVMLLAVYRHAVYGWYGLYALLILLLSVSFMGVASQVLWPYDAWWPENSSTVLAVLAMMAQLQFCRSMFTVTALRSSRTQASHWPRTAAWVLGLCSVGLAVYFVAPLPAQQDAIALALMLLCALAMLGTVLQALRRRSTLAMLWLLAYVPLLALGTLSILDVFGFKALPWLPYHAPVYALLWEMPVLLLALHLFAKREHALQVRDTTLATADVLGGYVPRKAFAGAMRQQWAVALPTGDDVAVVYVQFDHEERYIKAMGAPAVQRSLLRTVRLVRTVVREHDTLAHVGDNVLAIIMPGMRVSADLANRLARLVALARMTEAEMPLEVPLRLRVVASSQRSFSGGWDALHDALLHKLESKKGWSQRTIRYVGMRGGSSTPPASPVLAAEPVLSTQSFERQWEQALQASVKS